MTQLISQVKRFIPLLTVLTIIFSVQFVWVAFAGELKSRVPPDQLKEAQALKNLFTVTKEFINQERILFEGQAFSSACHGRDGRGMPSDGDHSAGPPKPTNVTDGAWQAARSDGEIFWILKNGSHGTDMAAFMPQHVNEREAWQLVTYLRSFQGA